MISLERIRFMPQSQLLNSSRLLTVELMMNKNFKSLKEDDSLRTVISYYLEYRINTLPVVDEQENLVGVFPKKRLFRALLEGAGLSEPVKKYMVDRPVFVTTDRTYDEYSLVVSVTKSRVDNVAVLDQKGKVVGMIGTAEYLRASLDVITQQVQYYKDELNKCTSGVSRFDQMISYNPVFQEIKKEARIIARSTSTVLLTGESGVGKDMFARVLHEASPRSEGPFIKVNCVSIPESLFESELFGYAPGSFTGALKSGKPGYFERANHGTVFLDEIGDMPLSIQVKLLQVLQEKEFTRVGGTEKQKVDVRIIAATNRDLREAISKKAFREDLYYRLNVIAFHLPPLRERPEDIVPLAQSFVQKYNPILGARITGIRESAKAALQQYDWPGNIRELENAIERAANYVWEGEIDIDNLPSQIRKGPAAIKDPGPSYKGTLMETERGLLLEVLEKAGGNKSAAARLLNVSRSTFYERLSKYGIK